ncbi:MAG: hypothetical protein HZB31_14450 [Nitrospirae bacterium]|nr:hypothetical protein [Nitrospirota bacterium]
MYKKIISIILCALVAGSFPIFPNQVFAETATAAPENERTEKPKKSEEEKRRKRENMSRAQQQPQPGLPLPSPLEPVAPATAGIAPPKPSMQLEWKKGEVSFFFDDADIFEVVQTVFGDVLGVNYLIDPKVAGRVNFRTVTPIPKSEVLTVMEVIFRLNGIGFLVEEGLYRIVPLADVSRELIYAQVGKDPDKVAMELFTFKNLNLKDSMKDIENAIGLSAKGGKIRVLPINRLNALLVVASTKEQLDYVRKWVETFDHLFVGAKPTVYVYPVQNSKAVNVASMLQEIFLGVKSSSQTKSTPSKTPQQTTKSFTAQSPSVPAQSPVSVPSALSGSLTPSAGESLVSEITRIFADEVANSIIILATPEDYGLISETIKKIDTVPRQVMIEALVAEIKLTDDMTFGLAWSLKTDVNISGLKPFNRDVNLGGNLGFNSAKLSGLDVTKLGGFAFAGVDSAGIVRTLLESLASDSKLRVLASPHILVSDNREAKIQIGDQVPIATSETNVSGTADIQRTIQYKDTGIILKVKPQVNESGLVALDLSQEVSNFSVQKILGSDQVVISKREATTNLVIQDGQTIVIGGLIQEDTSKSREGIPLLSKIPVLGYLFGSTTDKFARTELVILLTPHVIRNQVEAAKVSSDYLQRLNGIDKEIIKFRKTKEESAGPAGAGAPQ